jgi:hypothetical protein
MSSLNQSRSILNLPVPSTRILRVICTIAFVVGVLVAIFARILYPMFWLQDDALITATFARSMARGQWFHYGETGPSAGLTTPLWALISMLLELRHLPPVTLSYLSQFFLLLLISSLLFDRSLKYKAGIALLVLLDPYVLKWAGSGMEATLAMLLFYLHCRILRFETIGSIVIAASIGAVLALLRPEYAVLGVLAAWWIWISARQTPLRARLLHIVTYALIFAAPRLLWCLLQWSETNQFLPSTTVKMGGAPY